MYFTKSGSQKLQFFRNIKSFVKTYKFKIFKKTTRFKKHNIGLTKYIINRKKYHNRKRRSTNLLNYYISSNWSLNYRKKAQFIKYIQTLYLFNKTSAVININYVLKKIVPLPSVYINTACITKSLIYTKILFGSKESLPINLLNKNASIGYVYKNSISKVNDFYKIQPLNNLIYETTHFKELSISALANIKNSFSSLTSIFFRRSMFFLSTLYKILIQLSLMCLYL